MKLPDNFQGRAGFILVYIGYKRLSDNKTLRYPPLVLERHLLSKFGWMFSIDVSDLVIHKKVS